MITEALKRLFGTLLFIEPLINEEVLIAKLALDTISVEFPNPKDLLAKKKAQKKATKAAAAEKGCSSKSIDRTPAVAST